MRYAITSVDNIYPLNTKTEVLNMIDRFSSIKEYFKEEVAKNLYEVANEMNIIIPSNSEIYRFISLKNESVDKSNVFECEYYYVSSSELEEDSTFDDISKMSKSINKAIERSDIFKSNTSLNPNSDDGKSFTTNLYSCIKIDGNTFGFIKIALLNVIYYNRYTFNYEIIKVIDFDINSIYKSQTSNNLDEEIDIENDIDFYYLGESTELQKKTLKDSDYGIPELKKFPMHDKKHVLLAIKFFNTYVGTKYEKELADNINKKIIEFEIDDSEIHMTKVNQFVKYYKPYSKKTLEESYIINEKDIYYNKDKFDSGEINLCFITGHSGSGKSTMGRQMQNKNIEHYELDDLLCVKEHFSLNNLKEYGDLIYSFFTGVGKKYYIDDTELDTFVKENNGNYENILFPDFVHHAMKYAKMHKDTKFVLEGVWFFITEEYNKYNNKKPWFEPSEFKDYAFYIKGTSMLVSKYRASKRDSKNYDDIKFSKRFFMDNWKYYILDEKNIIRFRNYFKSLMKNKSINEEYFLLNETQNSIVNMYHLSQFNLDNIKIKPAIPDNFLTKNGYEDNKTPRVCFSKSVDGCLRGLSQNLTNKEFYVHVPLYQRNIKSHIVHPTTDKVPDCKITKEVWITVPVKMKCIGKIKVLKDRGEDGLPYTYEKGKNKHTAELYDWDWIWTEKYNGTSLDESLNSLLTEDVNKSELADKVIGLFKDNGFNPKISKKSLKDFITGKESDIGGKSLCIAGLGNEYNKLSKTCSLINKEIKPLGAKISPDNYGTAFLKVLKEEINHTNWYYVSSKKVDLKKGSVDEDLTYSDILSAIKGSSLVHDLKMYHKEDFYNKEHTGYLYKFDSDESKEGPYTPYYHGEVKFTVSQKDNKDDFYDWKLISVQNESVEIQEIKPDKCPKCESKNLQTYFKGEHFRIRCKDCKYELGKFSAEAVKNESSTAGVAVAPSVQGKSPYINTYPRRDEENNIPKGIKDVKNVLDDFYSVKEKPNMLSESLLPNKIFNEHPIFADIKTLFGYDRIRLNKDIFERYTEEFKKLGFNQKGKIFNPESDCGEIIVDKNKNIKACILINRNYVVRKLPYNILYFIYVDDSICDEKHTKEVWLQNLSNIAFNRYSCEFIEVDKSNKELIQYYVEDHYGFSVLDDNGKKLILTARTDLIESFNIVLTNNEPLLNEEVELESKYNMKEYSLDKLGTSSGVYSKLGLWNPIVKIKGQNYRERCEAIIFNNNNEVFMGINVNRTRIPGGGTMPNIPIEEQLKEECKEEVRINIKDINYIGCYKNVYTDTHREIYDKRSDIENVEYEGALTYLFTAKYDSKYTGEINALDRDDLINEGRFYPISKVLASNIKNEWKVAIINYLAKNSINDSYVNLWHRMTLDTNFLELVENNDKSTIKTEAYNILTEEENSSKLKAKRNKIEKLIYTTFNLLDSTGKNAEKYKEHYKSLSDKDFFKEIQSMLDDNKKNFYLEILPNVNEPSLKAVKETADYLDLELDNYIYYRNDGDNNEPVRSSYKVPVGGLTIKRLRVKRFLRIIPQKKLYLYNFN